MQRVLIVLALLTVLAASCRKRDIRTATIVVPDLRDDRVARIVTDVLVNELARNDANLLVDLKERRVSVSGDSSLAVPAVQRKILSEIREVGFAATVVDVRPVPAPNWPDRHLLNLNVPDMRNNRAANIVVGAIAHTMTGRDVGNIRVDLEAHTVTVTYDSMVLARMNLEHAIANAGFRTQDIPADLGYPDALPHGWSLPQ